MVRDETALTAYIASALNTYFKNQYGAAYTAHTTKQGLHNFVKSEVFPDIIKQIDSSSCILLEVKINKIYKKPFGNIVSNLERFRADQANFYVALENCGVPIYYSFNLGQEDQHRLEGEDILRINSALSPSLTLERNGFISNDLEIPTLLSVVDEIVGEARGEARSGAGVLFPFIVLPASQQGIRYVLIAYNRDIGFAVYDETHLRKLGDAVASFLKIKKIAHEAGDLRELSAGEITEIFYSYRKSFNEYFDNYMQSSMTI